MKETQERLNIIVSPEESELASAIAAREKTTVTDVLMQGLRCIAKQKGMKPLNKREPRNLFFKKGENVKLLLDILQLAGQPMSFSGILDEVKSRKGFVLDEARNTQLKASINVTLIRERKAGLFVEAFKKGGETYWKLPDATSQ